MQPASILHYALADTFPGARVNALNLIATRPRADFIAPMRQFFSFCSVATVSFKSVVQKRRHNKSILNQLQMPTV